MQLPIPSHVLILARTRDSPTMYSLSVPNDGVNCFVESLHVVVHDLVHNIMIRNGILNDGDFHPP